MPRPNDPAYHQRRILTSEEYGPAPVFLVPDADKEYDFPEPTLMPPDRGLHGKDIECIPPGVPLLPTEVLITSNKVSSHACLCQG